MDFGVVLQTDPPARRVVDFARKAEALGFTHAYTFDSHVLWQEPYVIHSAMLAATSTLTVGPMVTNPGTRDWTVTASVFATLNEMYGERTVCGIGRGDSAMRVIGYPSCNLATLEEAMGVIKGLAEGGEVDYNGTRQTFPWCDGGSLPMWMAAYGPKALALCGRKADGFILQLADPQIAAWTIGAVRRAAEEAGRDPDSITICVVAPADGGDDSALQRDQGRWFGGRVGNHVADLVGRYGTDGTAVPQALTDYIEGRKGYDYSEHGRAGAEHTEFEPDEIIDRFCILGDEAAHIARLEELRDLGGDQFAIYLMHDQQDETLDAYGRHVMPALSGN